VTLRKDLKALKKVKFQCPLSGRWGCDPAAHPFATPGGW